MRAPRCSRVGNTANWPAVALPMRWNAGAVCGLWLRLGDRVVFFGREPKRGRRG